MCLLRLAGIIPTFMNIKHVFVIHFFWNAEFSSLCMFGIADCFSLSVLAGRTWNFSLNLVFIEQGELFSGNMLFIFFLSGMTLQILDTAVFFSQRV